MTMTGKIAVAPCGHNGETIIGTYVRCLQGCEGGAKVARRGEPGHVDNCACKPCQIRRRTTTIVLRTRDGQDFTRFNWDGIEDQLHFISNKSGWVCAFKFLDKDGKVVADGRIQDGWGEPVYCEAGYSMTIKTKFMMGDASVRMEVSTAPVKFNVNKPFKPYNLKKLSDDDILMSYVFHDRGHTPSQIQDMIDEVGKAIAPRVCPRMGKCQ